VSDDLIAFLRARLDEDEQVALAVPVTEWREGSSWLADLCDPLPSQRRAYGIPAEVTLVTETDAAHIARWDPARVLAEVEAKRRILDIALAYEATIDGEWGCCHSADQIAAGRCPETNPDEISAIRVLAAPFADHPDYRAEWRPAAE
jgi:hypothetical protein